MQAFLPLLSYLIPMLGKALLMIPFVPNKAIPFLLGSLNVAHKYWVLAGFPVELPGGDTGSLETRIQLAGFGFLAQVIPPIWGIAEQYLFHRLYEGKRIEARVAGKTSWFEVGKRSMF